MRDVQPLGTTALLTGNENFNALSEQVHLNLGELEQSVSRLETSLDSLAEVALQNRRSIDLLLLKQGGLCMALVETCCFYTNHSEVVRDSLSQIRKRLKEREKARQHEENWYQSLFSWSTWLTTFISAIAGPLLLILLGFLIGPYIFYCLMMTQ